MNTPSEVPVMRRVVSALMLAGAYRVVLVGQAPSRRGDPTKPLTGRAGRRLAQLAGVSFPNEYGRLFARINVLEEWPGQAPSGRGDAFPPDEAARAARELALALRGRVVVMVGRGVATAFGLGGRDWLTWTVWAGAVWGLAPHPSGRSTWWNDRTNTARAALFMRHVAELARGRLELHRRVREDWRRRWREVQEVERSGERERIERAARNLTDAREREENA